MDEIFLEFCRLIFDCLLFKSFNSSFLLLKLLTVSASISLFILVIMIHMFHGNVPSV